MFIILQSCLSEIFDIGVVAAAIFTWVRCAVARGDCSGGRRSTRTTGVGVYGIAYISRRSGQEEAKETL